VTVVLLGVGLVLLALPGALRSLGARLSPSEWCRSVSCCLRGGRLAIHAGLALAAVPVALGAVGADHLAHACHRTLTAGLPGPAVVGWLAVGLLADSALASLGRRREDRAALTRLRAEPWLGRHRDDDGVDLVTLPCADQVAYAVPGRRGLAGQIVVSSGLAATLDDEELRSVLRHERAHLRHGHHRPLRLARDLEARFGWLPAVRASAATLRLAVERAADEDAAAVSPDARPAVRRALVKATALALGPVPAFTDAGTVAPRLRALAAPPPDPTVAARLAAAGPTVGLCALASAAVAACGLAAHRGLDGLLGHCPF
jgi:Zn-dependent protease with chaperone function